MGNLATQQYFVWNYYSNPIEHDSLVEFTGIPAGAWNCQLEWNLPANADLFSWGKTQLNIYTVDRDATASDTWNNSPQPVSLWGTTTLSVGGTSVVNGKTCSPNLTFRIEIARDSDAPGLVGWTVSDGIPGWQLRHSC